MQKEMKLGEISKVRRVVHGNDNWCIAIGGESYNCGWCQSYNIKKKVKIKKLKKE